MILATQQITFFCRVTFLDQYLNKGAAGLETEIGLALWLNLTDKRFRYLVVGFKFQMGGLHW